MQQEVRCAPEPAFQAGYLMHSSMFATPLQPAAACNSLQVNLTWLDLSFNAISKIEGLDKLTKLTDLSLFCNHIDKIENLQTLTNLSVLSIGEPVCVAYPYSSCVLPDGDALGNLSVPCSDEALALLLPSSALLADGALWVAALLPDSHTTAADFLQGCFHGCPSV